MLEAAREADSDRLREERMMLAGWWHAMAGPIEARPQFH
jgi:hypothetical protein